MALAVVFEAVVAVEILVPFRHRNDVTAFLIRGRIMPFAELGLDPVLVQTVKRRNYRAPTPIQTQCIPAVLKGQDVLALSRTGTGKTMAYLLPILQQLLIRTEPAKPWTVLILVPTKELILQVSEEFMSVLEAAGMKLGVSAFYSTPTANPAAICAEAKAMVICTPRQISSLLHNAATKELIWLQNLKTLVVDEADLILSYGYDADMKTISPRIPRSCQCILASATRSADLESIVKLVMENPTKIDLLGAEMPVMMLGEISHYALKCSAEDKAVHLYVLLQFKAIEQPVMIFVNGISEGYRLHLFLDCFRIGSSLLHRELPQNSRQRLIEDFNTGKSRVFIVVDDLQSRFLNDDRAQQPKGQRRKKKTPKEAEFGVARGLDFKNVKTVINYALPQTLNGYLHRVGRTGRGGNCGLALSFITPDDEGLYSVIEAHLNATASLEGSGSSQEAFPAFTHFSQAQVAALKYRASDVLRSLNRRAINDARKRDMRQEMLRSSELKAYWAAHPEEKRLLESIGAKNLKRKFSDINKLPSYIVSPENIEKTTQPSVAKSTVPKIDPLTEKAAKRRRGRRKINHCV